MKERAMRRLVIIALLLSSDPTLAYEDIYEALKTTNTPNHETGYGVVNAVEAFIKTPNVKVLKKIGKQNRYDANYFSILESSFSDDSSVSEH